MEALTLNSPVRNEHNQAAVLLDRSHKTEPIDQNLNYVENKGDKPVCSRMKGRSCYANLKSTVKIAKPQNFVMRLNRLDPPPEVREFPLENRSSRPRKRSILNDIKIKGIFDKNAGEFLGADKKEAGGADEKPNNQYLKPEFVRRTGQYIYTEDAKKKADKLLNEQTKLPKDYIDDDQKALLAHKTSRKKRSFDPKTDGIIKIYQY